MANWTIEVDKSLLLNPKAFQPKTEEDQRKLDRLKAEAGRRGHSPIPIDATTEGTPLQHRWLLEAAFPPSTFATNLMAQPNYSSLMATFSVAYALGTWLIIFGSIGLFMTVDIEPASSVQAGGER
ncbi:MAG: hypothetical protein ACYC3X_18535 [Pirellulaceae bacterium]